MEILIFNSSKGLRWGFWISLTKKHHRTIAVIALGAILSRAQDLLPALITSSVVILLRAQALRPYGLSNTIQIPDFLKKSGIFVCDITSY